jgi:hypothetical protein
MTNLEKLKETCIALGIAVPFVLLSMGTNLTTPDEGEKESKIRTNITIMSELNEDNVAANHVNRHTNKTLNGTHTNEHSNTSTNRNRV